MLGTYENEAWAEVYCESISESHLLEGDTLGKLLLIEALLNFPKAYFHSARIHRSIANAIVKHHRSVAFSPEVGVTPSPSPAQI